MPLQTATSTAPACTQHFTAASPYTVIQIGVNNKLLSQFITLHQSVLHALPSHGKHWLKRRIYSDIQKHLQQGHVGLAVLDAAGTMVGQALLTFPNLPGGKNLLGYPLGTGKLTPQNCAIIQTLGVSPQHQGQGLNTLLLQEAQALAISQGRQHLLAKTDSANQASIKSFQKAGYTASPETSVAGEAYNCVFMQKTPAAAKPNVKLHIIPLTL